MAGACSCESCLGKACGRVWSVGWGVSLRELPWKGLREGLVGRVAARVALERVAGRLKGLKGLKAFEGKQTAGLNARKNSSYCCWRPAEGFEGFEGGQTAVLNALKNRWLGRVAARVALERPAEEFEALAGACRCESCLGEACGSVWSVGWGVSLRELPWKGLREGLVVGATAASNCCWNVPAMAGSTPPVVEGLKGLKGLMHLRASKRQAWTPLKTDGCCCWRPAEGFEGFEGFEGGQTAVLNALKNRWLGRVAARVALERPAEEFEALAGACRCESCLGKACGKVEGIEGFEGIWEQTAGLNAGKNRWLLLLEACGRVWRVWGVWRRANGSLERP